MLAALPLLLLAVEHPITPIQGDLSASYAVGDRRNLLGGYLYVGGAAGWTDSESPCFFFGGGAELGYAAGEDPYRISLGAQLRAGIAFAKQRGFNTVAIPDLIVFARVTPFGAGYATRFTNPMGMTTTSSVTFFGVRAGIGMTALWGARMFLDNFPFFDAEGFAGEAARVLTALVLFPLALVNHAEVLFEYAAAPREVTAVVFRLGAGF